LFQSPTDAVEDEVAPEETEDDGAGEQEVEESYFHLSNPDWETEAEGARRSIVEKFKVSICFMSGSVLPWTEVD
jgi:hypothetical protein